MMPTVSVLIPARNEQFLQKTVDDLFAKAATDIEVIVLLDGCESPIKERRNLLILRRDEPAGMRAAINSCANSAHGKFYLKIDAHCMVAEGFDAALMADCDRDWIVVPRRYALDAESWKIEPNPKYPIDYHYLSYPWANPAEPGLHGVPWRERTRARKDILVDDEMSSQGSCWFMHGYYFHRMAFMRTNGYGPFAQEFQELGLNCWLNGGRVVVNKSVWYAHLHKGHRYGRGYPLTAGEMQRSAAWSLDYWWNDRAPRFTHQFDWLIDRFWPVPGWPENWKEVGWAA
jgi:glycosyltransferase involved in cell wall biosynthesis